MDGMASVGDIALGILGLVATTAMFAAVVWLIVTKIRHRIEDVPAAMKEYADARGLTFEGDGQFEGMTPLLRYRGKALGKVSGELAPGLQGELAHLRYDPTNNDTDREQAVLLTPLPEAGVARMYLDRGPSGNNALGDALSQFRAAELESAAFASRYSLRIRDDANLIAIRQLFAPSFIVFLTEEVPDGFNFELERGHLCVAVHGSHWKEPAELDELCRAALVVRDRIRADIAERMELRGAVSAPPPPPPPV